MKPESQYTDKGLHEHYDEASVEKSARNDSHEKNDQESSSKCR